MKRRFITIVSAFVCLITMSLTVSASRINMPNSSTVGVSEEPIYQAVEKRAQFPGGEAAVLKFIKDNIQYPEDAAEEYITGSVIVSFVVEKDGSLSNFKIVKGRTESLNKEAIRVVSSMPKWTPAQSCGEIVRSLNICPVRFVIEE